MSSKRYTKDERRAKILDAAMLVARYGNMYTMTLREVAEKADVTHALISHYFGSIGGLRTAVLSAALVTEDATIVMQAIFNKELSVDQLSRSQRASILNYVRAVLEL